MSTAHLPNVDSQNAASAVTVEQLEIFSDDLKARADFARAAQIYREHGALIVRGLMKPYLVEVQRDIESAVRRAIELLPQARKINEGWSTPDGTLWLPAPAGLEKVLGRDKQIMIPPVTYKTSGAFVRSAIDSKTLDIVEAIIGPDIELFMEGQCLYKEPVGGHPKHLHQDSAYFEHRFEGPVGVLCYAVDTDLQNGALHVVPGSHHFGTLDHIDTFSHLGLDGAEWPWERALPLCGKAGDAIFFHYKTIHGSQENHSAKARPVFIHRYRRPDDYVTINATSAQSREENQKRADLADKQNQHGWMVRGFRRFEEMS
ncbi:MAG TPA: phytanoyl-CoA dioxygenase family protein [Abditibacteriaceae bacterium]|nr:phytanoyl-CoA dioxygenase family protein [Abditibacteriaceae bacterium]